MDPTKTGAPVVVPARPFSPALAWAIVGVGALMVICAVGIALLGPKDSTGVQTVLTSLGTVLTVLGAVVRQSNTQASVNSVHGRLNGELDQRIEDAAASAVGKALAIHDAGLQRLADTDDNPKPAQ